MIIISPIIEEIIFRKLLQQEIHELIKIKTTFKSTVIPNLVSSIIFTTAHSPTWGNNAIWWIIPSLVLGELWRRHKNIKLCIFIHSWFNLAQIILFKNTY